jgi:hypothetical protein
MPMKNLPVIGIRAPSSLEVVQSLLQQNIAVRIRVSGTSMQPLLKSGDLVEIEPLPAATLPRLGDILFLCNCQGSPLVHRLIWRRRQHGRLHLLTKGDAGPGFDGFIPADKVLGRVQRIILADTGRQLNMNAPLQRLRACLLVSRTLSLHALRKMRFQLTNFRSKPYKHG